MAESVDALVSNTSGATRAGSTPALGTREEKDGCLSPFSFCILATGCRQVSCRHAFYYNIMGLFSFHERSSTHAGDTIYNKTRNVCLQSEKPPFGLQKAAFRKPIGGLSQGGIRPFVNTLQHWTDAETQRNIIFLTQNRKKSGCDLIFHLLTSNFAESRPDRQTA